MTQSLYRKWRPQKWDEIVGQQHVVQTLRNAVTGERVVHAYLFSGQRGTGKTTAARLLAKAVNCLAEDLASRPCNHCEHCIAVNEGRFLDLIEIDAASNTGVDDVRDLRDKINFSPNQGRYKVYIIDEVHMLSTAAFNALLKTLEESPPHAIFVLATTEIHKIPATVLSRCQRHEFRRIPMENIIQQLGQIITAEGIQADPEALTLIARQATGSMRDAISLLDQMASTGAKISLELTQTVLGTATTQAVLDLVDALIARRSDTGLQTIHRALDAGVDARLLARQIVDYLRALLLFKLGNDTQADLSLEIRAQAKRQAEKLPAPEILRLTRLFNAAAADQRGCWQPSLSLELALAEWLEEPSTEKPPAENGKKPLETSSRPDIRPGKTGVGVVTSRGAPDIQQKRAVFTHLQHTPPNVRLQSNPVAVPPPAEATPMDKRSGGAVSLEQVTKVWRQIRTMVRQKNPLLEALLNSCKLVDIKEGVLVLGFASEMLRSKMDTPGQLEAVRKVIAEVLGIDLPLRCVTSNSRQSSPPDVKPDGMVAAALEVGGEIVDIQE